MRFLLRFETKTLPTSASTLKDLARIEGLTLPEIKELPTLMGANRIAIRPKSTHLTPDFPKNDFPEALSFCRIYHEAPAEHPAKLSITGNTVTTPVGVFADGKKLFAVDYSGYCRKTIHMGRTL